MFERLRPAYYLLIGLALALTAVAVVLGQSDFWRLVSAEGLPLMVVLIAFGIPLIWVAGIAMQLTSRRADRPIATMLRMIRKERRWLTRGIFLGTMVIVFARAFSSFKNSISRLNGFWADPWLVELDYLTFGTDPWRLTHAIFGSTATLIIDRIYIFWFFMVFMTLGWLCFTRNAKLQVRGLLCYLMAWSLLGGVAAVLFSSVGPCFYEQFYGNDRFAPMMTRLYAVSDENPLYAARAMQFLIDSLGVDRFGSGISAMPSLHVTMALLSFLAVLNYSKSITLKIASGLFGAAIFVGSVHLGWHYAWDGIFGIAAVMLFWWGTGKFVDWLEARENQRSSAPGLTPLPAIS